MIKYFDQLSTPNLDSPMRVLKTAETISRASVWFVHSVLTKKQQHGGLPGSGAAPSIEGDLKKVLFSLNRNKILMSRGYTLMEAHL